MDQGLQYTSIRVKDVKKSVYFYTKLMGLKETGRRSPVPGEIVISLIDTKTKQRLNLMHYTKKFWMYTPYVMNGVELDHLMFFVKDAKKAYETLRKKGAPAATKLWERPGRTMGFVKDPNGIWVGVASENKIKK
jgi:catechol 2,3-dioxygenase-like lactoylglutathione lyase family enzyme